MLFRDIPGIYLACEESFALSALIPETVDCGAYFTNMTTHVHWDLVPSQCTPFGFASDHSPMVEDLLEGNISPTVRLFIMHNMPGSSGQDNISFLSTLHRADFDVQNFTRDDVLDWYVDSMQLFMAEDSEDPSRIQFRQTWDKENRMAPDTGCEGHWQYYPNGDRWYDVQALGLVNFFENKELVSSNETSADTGYGNLKMIRIDEVPVTMADVAALCKERKSSFQHVLDNSTTAATETFLEIAADDQPSSASSLGSNLSVLPILMFLALRGLF